MTATEPDLRWLADFQYRASAIKTAEPTSAGWVITDIGGWGILVPAVEGLEPKAGDTILFFGAGIGRPVRGIVINGVVAYYRTAAEDREHREIEMYGRDAADILARWDAGKTVHSIEMGGIGPGYEQALQITVFEIIRFLIANPSTDEAWEDHEREMRAKVSDGVRGVLEPLGLSGAQFGAALWLGVQFYLKGPRALLTDEKLKDRHIVVSRDFPTLPVPPLPEAVPLAA